MKSFCYIILGILFLIACSEKQKRELATQPLKEYIIDNKSAFKIEILDDEALNIIEHNQKIKVEGSGFTWTEGPLWVDEESFFLFSDIPKNKVYKLENGDSSTYLFPSGMTPGPGTHNEPGSNGLLLNPEGELILMQHGDRRVVKMNANLSEPAEKYVPLADKYKGKRFNSPNDGAYDKEGNLYFTDPPYGLPGLMDDPNKELSYQGVYCLLKNGEVILLDSLTRPNGIAISPDNKKLLVAVSDPTHAVWYKYDLASPGKVSTKNIFYDLTHLVGKEGQQGLPDGLKINSEGYIFATGAGGVWIFTPDAKPIARIHTGQLTANCAFGRNQKKLFMCADDFILSVELK